MRAVMYHYVREYNKKFPFFRYLDFSNFCRQLEYFSENFGFVERNEWERFVQTGQMPKENGKVVLTFDDAIIDHYDYVFKELRKRSLWSIFYIPASPYVGHGMLDVHRIHLLCGSVKGSDLLDQTLSIVTEEMLPDEKREEFRNKTYSKHDDIEEVTEVKRILNYFIDYTYRTKIIDGLFGFAGLLDDPHAHYMSEDHIREMAEWGMIIGSHTVHHPLMSKLNRAEQNAEISQSFEFLSSICKIHHKTYCHPYGGFHSFNNDTLAVLESNGVDYSFNVESRYISSKDRTDSKHFLPRFDCNEFPFGKAS